MFTLHCFFFTFYDLNLNFIGMDIFCNGSFEAGNSFSASWQVYDDEISFNISAMTTGWVGIGFSFNQFMVIADRKVFFIGTINYNRLFLSRSLNLTLC